MKDLNNTKLEWIINPLALYLLSFILIILFYSDIVAQKSNLEELKSPEKKPLLILPSEFKKYNSNSIQTEISTHVANIAINLGRYDVIDRNALESIMEEQRLQLSGVINDSMIVEIGNISSAAEGLIIDVLAYSQKGVPPKEEKNDEDDDDNTTGSFWGEIGKALGKGIIESIVHESEKKEKYPNNIQTILSVSLKKVNIETGQVLQSATIEVGHTGGNRGKSREATFKKFKRATLIELKNFYLLTMTITILDDGRIFIPGGYEIGINKGTMFEIIRPAKTLEIRGKVFKTEGERVGFVEANEILDEGNFARPIKVWEPIRSGYTAVEFHRPIVGGYLSYTQLTSGAFGLNLVAEVLPFDIRNGWIALRYINGKDSRDERDHGFGIDLGPSMMFYSGNEFSLRARGGLGGLFFFKEDDAGKVVNSASFTILLGVSMEYYLSATKDISIFVGYRSDSGSDKWKSLGDKEKDEPDYDAVWDGQAPDINVSGFFLTIGFKFTNLKTFY
ncbi:MAG: hypothetical protein IIB94_06965 [Candidatus Marinimicrobia bacterium]|nr:hypothetical protein [Candidatus Neomarinimicrobiota bacterium]